MTEWKQERPKWCPHSTCQFLRSIQGVMCCGELPELEPHDKDYNTHRFCLNGAGNDGGVFDLQVNKGDIFHFRVLFWHICADPHFQALKERLKSLERALQDRGRELEKDAEKFKELYSELRERAELIKSLL